MVVSFREFLHPTYLVHHLPHHLPQMVNSNNTLTNNSQAGWHKHPLDPQVALKEDQVGPMEVQVVLMVAQVVPTVLHMDPHHK